MESVKQRIQTNRRVTITMQRIKLLLDKLIEARHDASTIVDRANLDVNIKICRMQLDLIKKK